MKSAALVTSIRTFSPCLALFAAVSLSVSAQGTDAVSIDKQPLALQKRYFEDSAAYRGSRTPRTDWQFRCVPQIAYDIVETGADGTRHSVKLKIKGINLKLSLPIVMLISKNEPKLTIDHEFGHVKICAHVYQNADRLMHDYAKSMLGKLCSGQGPTEDDACTAALKTTLDQLSARFTSITNDRVKRISQLYDKLDATTKLPVATQVKLAEQKEAGANLRAPIP